MRLLNQLFVLSILMHTVFVLPVAAQEFSSKYMATFFVGDSGTQYFIKPLRFDGQQYHGYLTIDFTFRHLSSNEVPVVAKFSFIKPQAVQDLDSLVIKTPKANLVLRNPATLFVSPYKIQKVHSRYTSTVLLPELLKVTGDDWWIIDAWSKGEYIRYVSSNRAKKALRKISRQFKPVFLSKGVPGQ
jgi:hypothetical protein